MALNTNISKKALGEWGEKKVIRLCTCPNCKKPGTLKQLPLNFKCADIICDFCGYLAQVKTSSQDSIENIPDRILGAAWSVQKERMDSSIYFPLFLVVFKSVRVFSIFYLSKDLQNEAMFIPRKPLSKNAKRAGWQGFIYLFSDRDKASFVRLY